MNQGKIVDYFIMVQAESDKLESENLVKIIWLCAVFYELV